MIGSFCHRALDETMNYILLHGHWSESVFQTHQFGNLVYKVHWHCKPSPHRLPPLWLIPVEPAHYRPLPAARGHASIEILKDGSAQWAHRSTNGALWINTTLLDVEAAGSNNAGFDTAPLHRGCSCLPPPHSHRSSSITILHPVDPWQDDAAFPSAHAKTGLWLLAAVGPIRLAR